MHRIINIIWFSGLSFIYSCGGGGGANENEQFFDKIVPRLSIITYSSISEGSRIDTIVDGKIDDGYVEAELPFKCIVSIGRKVRIREIIITWGSELDYGTTYTIEDVGYSRSVDEVRLYSEIISVKDAVGQIQHISFENNLISATFLRLRVSGVVGNPNAMIRQIMLVVDPPDDVQKIILENRNKILMTETHPENPLRHFKLPITLAMKKLGDYIIEPHGALTDHQKIVRFMTFLNGARVGFSSLADPEVTILEDFGACGSWTVVLAALATAQDIPCRILALYNYPTENGHNVAEALINGKWQVYDPTYAAYYTPDPDNEISPVVLNFDELKRGLGEAPGTFRVVKNPERLSAGGATALAFVGPEIYSEANPKGVIGPDRPMVFPLWLDSKIKPSISQEDFGPKNQGAWIIGSAFVNVSQEFTLTGLTPGQQYDLIAHYTEWGGDVVDPEEFLANSQIAVGGSIESGNLYRFQIGLINDPWIIRFTAGNDVTYLLLTHAYLEPFYLLAGSYTLVPSNESSFESAKAEKQISGEVLGAQPRHFPKFPFFTPPP